MRTIKITITDEDGVILDRGELEVTSETTEVRVSEIDITWAVTSNFVDLVIGKGN